MKCFLALLPWMLLAAWAVAYGDDLGPLGITPEFQILGTDYPVSNLAMSEDGNWLIVIHEETNMISVVDTRTGAVIKEFRCQKPSFALCRGGKLFVTNRRQGSVSVYSMATWEMLDKIPVGGNDVFYLAAPAEEHFHNLIFVKNRRKAAVVDQKEVYLVDTTTGTSRLLYANDAEDFTVDHAGKTVVFSRYCSGVCDYEDYLQGRKEKSLQKKNIPNLPLCRIMRQIGDSPFWVYSSFAIHENFYNTICSGTPLAPAGDIKGLLILPDQKGAYAYVINETLFNVLKPQAGFSIVASQKIALPEELKGALYDYENTVYLSHAVRHDGDVHMFLLKLAKPISPSTALYHVVFRGILAGAGSAAGGLPEKVVVGTPVSARIFKETVKDATIVNAPDGTIVTPEGILKWTPGQPGICNFKIRATVGGNVVFQRFSIDVVAPAPVKEPK